VMEGADAFDLTCAQIREFQNKAVASSSGTEIQAPTTAFSKW